MASPEAVEAPPGTTAAPHGDGAARGPVDRAIDRGCAVVEGLLAVLMVAMVGMVLGNVILRYAFGTGIVVSEELSRMGLVWITFIGAVVAWWRGLHLGVDTVVNVLPPVGKWLCEIASEALAVLCCVLVVVGTAQQHEISATTKSLVAGIPMIWMYGMGYFAGAGIAALALLRLLRAVRRGPRALEALPHPEPTEVAL